MRQLEAKVRERDDAGVNSRRALEKEFRRVQSELDKVIGAIAREVITDEDARQQVTARKAEMEDLRQKIDDTQSQSLSILSAITDAKVKRFAESLATLLRDGDIKFRQAYLRLFIERIEARKGELVMTGPGDALAGAAANPGKLADNGVNAFVQVWRALRDESVNAWTLRITLKK